MAWKTSGIAYNNGNEIELRRGDFVEVIRDCDDDEEFIGVRGFVIEWDDNDTTYHIKMVFEDGNETYAKEVKLIANTNLGNVDCQLISRDQQVQAVYDDYDCGMFKRGDVMTLDEKDDSSQPYRVVHSNSSATDWLYFVLPKGVKLIKYFVDSGSVNTSSVACHSEALVRLMNSTDEDEENTFTIVPQQTPLF